MQRGNNVSRICLYYFNYSRPPKIAIGLYHYPWFIFSFALHRVSFLFLYCFVVQCITVCLAFWFLATSSVNWIWTVESLDLDCSFFMQVHLRTSRWSGQCQWSIKRVGIPFTGGLPSIGRQSCLTDILFCCKIIHIINHVVCSSILGY